MISIFTQIPKGKSKETIIIEQFQELLENIGNDKECIYCSNKRVNINLNIDRKFMYGLVSQTFYNSSNNLQTVDVCPVCAYLSMISILNIQKIGMPTLYISDSDDFMRSITKSNQTILDEQNDLDELFNIPSNFKSTKLIEIALLDISNIGYITQFCFQNSGQLIGEVERTIYKKDIELLKRLDNKGLLEEFMSFGLHDRLALGRSLVTDMVYCSSRLLKELEVFELKEEEKKIIEYAADTLIEIEDSNKLLKEIKLCNTQSKFNNFILNYSEKKALVKDVKHYDILTGYNWAKYRDYINMHILIQKNKEAV